MYCITRNSFYQPQSLGILDIFIRNNTAVCIYFLTQGVEEISWATAWLNAADRYFPVDSYQRCTSPLIGAPTRVLPLFPVLSQESQTQLFLGSPSSLSWPPIHQEIKFHAEVVMLLSLGLLHVTTLNSLLSIYYIWYSLLVNLWYLEVVDVTWYGHLLPINHNVSNTVIIGINNKPFLFGVRH